MESKFSICNVLWMIMKIVIEFDDPDEKFISFSEPN